MPLRKLTLIIICVTSLALAGAIYIVSRIIISKSFTDLENKYVVKNVERVLDALAYDASSLNLKAADWAEWDDTYNFVDDLNERYIKENLTDETFQIIRANVLIFLDTGKNIRHQKGFDLAESKPEELDQKDLAALLSVPGLASHEHEKSQTFGIVVVPKGPMLVASRPILNSHHSGPIKGVLIMGRYLDKNELEDLSKRVHAELSIQRLSSASSDPEFTQALDDISKGNNTTVAPVSDSDIAGFTTIKDVSGTPSLAVKVLMSRDITQHGAWTTVYLLFSLILVTGAFGIVTLVVLEKMIISRLLGLESELRSIEQSDEPNLRVTVEGSDEITKVATQINKVLESVENSENELRNSRDTIQALLNASSDAALLLDKHGNLLAMNEATAKALGESAGSLIGRSPLDFFPNEVSELRRRYFSEAVKTGNPLSFEDTNNDRIFHHNVNPVRGTDGDVGKVAIFTRDVTEEKRTQQLLIEGTRLKAIGEMASGVAHNFNNVLQLMIGTAQTGELLLERGRLAEATECFRKICNSAELGAQTAKRLQDFGKARSPGNDPDVKIFDLTKAVENALEMTIPVWKTKPGREGINISLETMLEPDCFIKGQDNEIIEVIINLIKNAVEAMPLGGRINIRTGCSGKKVFFEITDTGIGIDQKDLEKVFTPFWSTKGFKGTGIGLASSHGIIRSHGGEISAGSQKGIGTTFTFTIPKVD